MKKCVIFGAGEYDARSPVYKRDNFYIAADAGLKIMEKLGIKPDLLIGDFDSLKSELPQHIQTVSLPVEKDVTDMDAAVGEGLKRGYKSFELYGGMGGRPDHTLANVSLLARLSQNGICALMFGEGFAVTALTNGKIRLKGEKDAGVSVFSWTDISDGVSIKGLKYEIENTALRSSFALGVSNSFTDKSCEISVRKGTLIIMAENNTLFY